MEVQDPEMDRISGHMKCLKKEGAQGRTYRPALCGWHPRRVEGAASGGFHLPGLEASHSRLPVRKPWGFLTAHCGSDQSTSVPVSSSSRRRIWRSWPVKASI